MHYLFHILNASFYQMFKAQCMYLVHRKILFPEMTAWGLLHYHGVTQGQSPQDWDLDLQGATAQTRVTTLSHLHCF